MDKFVIVNGGTKEQRQLVHNITGWFCNKFFNRFKSYNIEFDLCKIKGNVQGWAMEIDRNASHIEIDKRLKGDDFITCVLHELVHVKQQFKKELVELNGKAKRWKDEIHIGIMNFSDMDKIEAEKIRMMALTKDVFVSDYMELPWEIEAYAMQETLLIEWKENGWWK
jgi:type I site-specific restriction endonuclease